MNECRPDINACLSFMNFVRCKLSGKRVKCFVQLFENIMTDFAWLLF